MVVNLRDGKARLSELVELAHGGEEILITVRGKVKARLVGAGSPVPFDGSAWALELRQALHDQPVGGTPVEQLLDLDRDERRL